MDARRLAHNYAESSQRVVRRLRRASRRVLDRTRPYQQAADAVLVKDELSPSAAFEMNGFCVLRQLFDADDLERIESDLVKEYGTDEFDKHLTACDAANRVSTVSQLVFDSKLLGGVRSALGNDVRFLQTSGMQANNDFVSWHRDSACRQVGGPDWDESADRYIVAKSILYVRGTNTTLAVFPGSHVTEVTMDHMRQMDDAGQATVVEASETANRRYTEDEMSRPMVLCAKAGDVVIFDQRMYHRGGRFDEESKAVLTNKRQCQRGAEKLTLSWVFGAPNSHSERHYSYFRYARRDLSYRPINEELRGRLIDAGLYLGEANYFHEHPDEVDAIWLRKPETRDDLKRKFAVATVDSTIS